MSSRRPLRSVPPPTESCDDYAKRNPSEILTEILDRVARSERPVIPYCRVRDLTPPHGPLSKPTVFRMLNAGQLRAVRVGGLLLIEIASVRELVANAEPWTPKAVK